jgi:heterodisulfide reductase subunit D
VPASEDTCASLDDFLGRVSDEITDACTRCGKCVEVCPVIPYGQAASANPSEVVRGVADFLKGKLSDFPVISEEWASTCNGCGECIPICPENINPRKMLVLASGKHSAHHSKTPELFRRMSRSIRIMSAMQLVPEEFKRVFVPPRPRDVPIVFYLGCNALRTPHLLFNSMQLLDAVGADYEVVGGPSSCCGVIATKWEGQAATGERVLSSTIDRFESFKPDKVLNWCPSCQLHLGETLEGYRKTSYEFDHVTAYLVDQLDRLKEKFVRSIPKRVVVHAHVGRADICRNVNKLLRAIPGIDIADTVYEAGYTCGGSGCSKVPELAAKEHAEILDRAREMQADVLVTLYHGCHSILAGVGKDQPFQVLNFTDLLVEALGVAPHVDRLKHYRLLDDWKMIVEEAQPFLKANGLAIDDAWLARHGQAIFAAAEFKGQLDCYEDPPRTHAH